MGPGFESLKGHHPEKGVCGKQVCEIRPVGQAVKTSASHAGNMGSIPIRVTTNKKRNGLVARPQGLLYKAGANDGEVTPVPIPNTEVKLISADNTWTEGSREDRSAPATFLP